MMRKRTTTWLVGGSVWGAVLAGAVVAACSSSSGGGADAGNDATSNGGTDGAASGDGNFLLSDGGCLPSAYDIETVEAGAVWACYQSICGSELTMCAGDCVCNDDILTALQCTANGGSANDCFTAAFGATYILLSSNVVIVANCVVNTSMSGACPNGSPTSPDAGADSASADAGQDEAASPDGASDAGTPDGSADSASADAGADGAGGDATPDAANLDAPGPDAASGD